MIETWLGSFLGQYRTTKALSHSKVATSRWVVEAVLAALVAGALMQGVVVDGHAVQPGVVEVFAVQGVPVPLPSIFLHYAIGAVRWRAFWCLAYLFNVVSLTLILCLNMCAPLTLEWLELSGPIRSFLLTEEELTIYDSVQCCDLPLLWYPFRKAHTFTPPPVGGLLA